MKSNQPTEPKPVTKTRNAWLTIRVKPEWREAWRAKAESEGRTVSAWAADRLNRAASREII